MINDLLNEAPAVHHETWANPAWWWLTLALVVVGLLALFWPSRDLFVDADTALIALGARAVAIIAAGFAVHAWARHTADSRWLLVVLIVAVIAAVAAVIHHHKVPPLAGIPAGFLAVMSVLTLCEEGIQRAAAAIPLGPTPFVVVAGGAALYGVLAAQR